MKKLIFLLLTTFLFNFSLFAQEERELSNYEKYRLEKEREDQPILQPQDTIFQTDTVYVEAEEDPVIINNYYVDNTPDMRFQLAFGYGWGFNPYFYGYNHWGWGYPYYGSYYPYNYWYGYYPYYRPYYRPYYNNYRETQYASRSALGRNNHYYQNNRTYKEGFISRPTQKSKTIINRKSAPIRMNKTITVDRNTNRIIKTTRSPINKNTRSIRNTKDQRVYTKILKNNKRQTTTRKAYKPNYQRPVNRSKAQYNNSSGKTQRSRSYTRPTQSRSYSTPNRSTQSRSNSTYSRSSSSSRGSATRSSSSGRSSSGSSSKGRR